MEGADGFPFPVPSVPAGVPGRPGVSCILLYPKHMWCRWPPRDGAPANTSLRLWYRMR